MIAEAEKAADGEDVSINRIPVVGDVLDRSDILLGVVVDVQADDLRA